MAVGGKATEGATAASIPSKVELKITDHGKQRSVIVSIDNVPKNFQGGTIYFVFNRGDGVQAKALKEDDDAGYAELIKGLRPAGEYRLGFIDKTGRDLEHVSVNAGGTTLGGPNLARGDLPSRVKVAISDPLLPPIPPEAELQWKQDGVPCAAKVKLDEVPKGFEGIIYFVVNTDGTVKVHPIRNGDDKSSIELVK